MSWKKGDALRWDSCAGESFGHRARRFAEAIWRSELDGEGQADLFRGYGDGHLAPHEWVRDSNGHIFKTDCCGHDADHTLVGRQSVFWDVAGALNEWQLDAGAEARFLDAVQRAG